MDGESNKPVTSYDVAKLAGVSQSAVSRAFSPNASVSQRVRDRVFEAARQLNYVPNQAARSLIQGQSDIIGVMLSDHMILNFPNLILTISQTLEERKKRLLLFANEPEANVEAQMMTALSYQLDGLICAHSLPERVAALAEARRLPVVLLNRQTNFPENPGIMSVRCDQYESGKRLGRQLLDSGARRILVITGPKDWPVSTERADGLKEIIGADRSRTLMFEEGDYSYESGWAAIESTVRHGQAIPFDAVVGINDPMAMGAMDCLRSSFSVSIPDTIKVAGFDDAPASKRVTYGLTSMRQPLEEMITTAVELVAGDREPEHVVLEADLIARRTL